MPIRSKFLVHWPGRNISEASCDEDAKRVLYIQRLRDAYVDGIFARKCDEGTLRQMQLKRVVRICFTEIKLSQTETHTRRYGALGIGFERKYIINRGGRPVIYIPFQAENKLMEDTIRYVYTHSKGEMRNRLRWLFAFVKRMSDKPLTHVDYQDYLEEFEWRVVYGEKLDTGNFKRMKDGTYRWGFAPKDVRVLVLPDNKAKEMALNDPDLKPRLRTHTPVVLTLEDCMNF